jgi:predicted tellurium resistance membrane protein TerC
MTSSQHFLLSFAASIFGATILVVAVFLAQDWLNEHDIPSYLLGLVVFIGGHFVIRWCFQNFVPIACPHCSQKRCFPMQGRSDRFRCEVCGADS